MAVTRQITHGGKPFIVAVAAAGLGVLLQATSVAGAGNVAKTGITTAGAGYDDAALTQVFEKKKKKKKRTLRGTQTRGSYTDG